MDIEQLNEKVKFNKTVTDIRLVLLVVWVCILLYSIHTLRVQNAELTIRISQIEKSQHELKNSQKYYSGKPVKVENDQ